MKGEHQLKLTYIFLLIFFTYFIATYALTYATYALLMFILCFNEAHEASMLIIIIDTFQLKFTDNIKLCSIF